MLKGFNFRIIWEYMPLFLEGLRNTFLIATISILLAIIVGIIACGCRLSQWRLLRGLATVYIESIRATPLLVQIYFFYFGLPTLGIRMPELQTGIIALMLNSGAYMAEIIRAGITAVSTGQIEAGVASGLNYFQRMRLYYFAPGAGRYRPTAAGPVHCSGQRYGPAVVDFRSGTHPQRPGVDIRALYAHRSLFYRGGALFMYLFLFKTVGRLVPKATDIQGGILT